MRVRLRSAADSRRRKYVVDGRVLDTIAGVVRRETIVTRSRFIADLAPVTHATEAEDLVQAARREFHGARHHCAAYVIGPQGEYTKSSDDGEPAGTAGAPMLAVLEGAGLSDVAVVVTRYFGGTLLGAGGLVRAYGGAVTDALGAARRVRRRRMAICNVGAGHADAGQLEHRLRTWAATVNGQVAPGSYDAEGVTIEVALPPNVVDQLQALVDASGLARGLEQLGHRIEELS